MEQDITSPAVNNTPCEGNNDRLGAARRFAASQYDNIRRATAHQVDGVKAYTKDAREQLHVQWDTTRDKAVCVHKVSEDFVKENPTATVLGALGVGVIIGLILGRR